MGTSTDNRVRQARGTRDLTQRALAEAVGISRQALSAIEAGRADPSVALALRISEILGRSVEDLFGRPAPHESVAAELSDPSSSAPGSRVALAYLHDRWVAHGLPSSRPDSPTQAADGIVLGSRGASRVRVEPLRAPSESRDNVMILGCAPALGMLADRLNRTAGTGHFVWLPKSSGAALDRFARHQAHVAGIHLGHETATSTNVDAVRKVVSMSNVAVVTLASWDAGLVVRRGNPLSIRGVESFVRPAVRVVRREEGAGAQQLLERELRNVGLDPAVVLAESILARGHLEAAFAVAIGAADSALTMRQAALAYELDFIPLVEERFDLVLDRDAATDARLGRMLDVLQTQSFRRELECLGGYDASACGASVSPV